LSSQIAQNGAIREPWKGTETRFGVFPSFRVPAIDLISKH